MYSGEPSLKEIYDAANKVYSVVRKTPLCIAEDLSRKLGSDIYYKLEFLQDTGSFKLRGASNLILNLSDEEKCNGLVTYSTGNHGRATAYAGKKLGVNTQVCLSQNVPNNKREGIRKSGGELVVYGNSQDQAMEKALNLKKEKGVKVVPPFDDPYIIAGQGTIALEIMDKIPDLDSIIVPLSGGGLISGLAVCVKTINPDCKVYGVSMDKGAAMYESIKNGKPVQVKEVNTLADSLQGGILLNNQYTFSMVKKYVDEIILVTEKEIKDAVKYAFLENHFVLEGAAAVGIAALKSKKIKNLGKKTVVITTGTNIDSKTFLSIIT